jgi:hypothetical protein
VFYTYSAREIDADDLPAGGLLIEEKPAQPLLSLDNIDRKLPKIDVRAIKRIWPFGKNSALRKLGW